MNTRWRQISKFITDTYERWEYIGENEVSDNNCPCCGAKIREQNWSGELGYVETDRRCRECNYLRNWSYGYTSLQVGEWDGEYPHSTPDIQVEEIEAEFSRQIVIERVRRKEQIRKYYRKLKRRG